MIDPTKITKYNRTDGELEELLLFCIAVAGKNATTTSKNLDNLLTFMFSPLNPFENILELNRQCRGTAGTFPELLKSFGFGCYNLKSKGFLEAARSKLDLRKCSVKDLEALPGIGMKTARFFVLHTRRDAQVACLDTHILKWLEYYTGYEVPKHTPNKTKYLELEQVFLQIAKTMKISPADLDLKIWNKQRGSDEESVAKARKGKTK